MLHENIRNARKSKGMSQEELAVKLNVVRQTVSKWEKGLSVPDADLLVRLSEELDLSVADLLGETLEKKEADALETLAQKLEVVNLQLARQQQKRRKIQKFVLIGVMVLIVVLYGVLAQDGSSYLSWDLKDPETAVAVTILHGLEWVFVRLAPLAFIACAAFLACDRFR